MSHGRCRYLLSVCFILPLACSKSVAPPRGPKHQAENSAEAKTACPKERKAAQSAREAMMEFGEEKSSDAGDAVFKHAQCELEALKKSSVPQGNYDSLIAQLRTLRGQMHTAHTLFGELKRYPKSSLSDKSLLGQGACKAVYWQKLSQVRAPQDLDTKTMLSFESEFAESKLIVRQEAEEALEQVAKNTDKGSELFKEACTWLGAIESPSVFCKAD